MFKNFIKHRLIGTQHEWESHINNIFRIFDRNEKKNTLRNMLDAGCGKGDRTISLANYFKIDSQNIFGLDFNDDCIIACKDKFHAIKLDLEVDDIPYADNSFDLVICNQVLEHLKNYQKVMDDLIRVAKKDGYIVIGIPNLAHLINRLYLLFGKQPLCINLDGSHLRAFTHNSFSKKISSIQNVKLIDCAGALMYPLPFFLGEFLSDYFIGLTGYICYLLQKTH